MFYEKYLPQRLNTDDDPRTLKATDMSYARNVRTMSASKKGTVESPVGNTLYQEYENINGILPTTGTNRVVGVVANEERIIIFNYNSDSKHGIYQYKADTGKISRIMLWSGLNFSVDENITELSLVGSILTWCSKAFDYEPLSVNIDRALLSSESSITLIKKPPTNKLTITRTSVTGSPNRIGRDAFMFTYRYIYKDYYKSVFSAYSELFPADSIYDRSNPQNAYRVRYELNTDVMTEVLAVEFAVKRNNAESLEIIERIDNPPTSGEFYFKDDKNTFAVSAEEAAQNFEPIPKAKAHAHFKGRHWLANTELGYDVVGLNISLSATPRVKAHPFTYYDKVERPGSTKEVGVILYDQFLRSTGVLATTTFQNEDTLAGGDTGFTQSLKHRIGVNLSMSSIPDWVRYVQFAVTKDKSAGIYTQIPVNYHFYVSDYDVDDDTFTIPSGMTGIDGKLFLRSKPTTRDSFKHLYLQVPENIPVLPTKEMFVKMLTKTVHSNQAEALRIEPVLDFIDGWIVVKDFNIKSFTNMPKTILVELFMEGINDEIFFETGGLIEIPEGNTGFSTSVELDGDSYVVSTLQSELDYKYTWIKKWEKEYRDPGTDVLLYTQNEEYGGVLYSPTKSFRNGNSTEVEVTQSLERVDVERKGFLFFKKTETNKVYSYKYSPSAGYVLDYARIPNAYGRPNTKIYNERKSIGETDIMFSGQYVPNANYNDLSSFSIVDKETLNIERSPIRKLIPAGDVLLAIHENTVTSIYVGEGFIRQGEDSILAKTVNVIGDERNLAGGYGTLHPESVCEYEGKVFFWDSLKGCVCRYTRAGLYPISHFKMKEYFKAKAGLYNNVRVVGGIDPINKQYLITFPGIPGHPSETIAFNFEEDQWESWYDLKTTDGDLPERFAHIGLTFFSFMKGQFWQHNTGEYLKFYGEEKTRSIKVRLCPAPTINKRFHNIHLHADTLANYTTEDKVIVLSTPRGQNSFTPFHDVERENGVYYIPILKDTGSYAPPGQLPLRDGDEIIDDVLDLEVLSKGNLKGSLYRIVVVFVNSDYTR